VTINVVDKALLGMSGLQACIGVEVGQVNHVVLIAATHSEFNSLQTNWKMSLRSRTDANTAWSTVPTRVDRSQHAPTV
jgi:hypothetical protein